MLDHLIRDFPIFFTANNMILLAAAAGNTVLLTLLGCGIGAVIGFILVYVRQSKAIWLLPIRLLLIAYVEIFRRIPFLVILFIVLFAVRVRSEEEMMAEKFGDEYRNYLAKTKRLIPGIW